MDILNFIRPRSKHSVIFLACGCTFALLMAEDHRNSVVSTLIDVTGETLRVNPPAANWPSYNGDYSGRRYSNLAEITPNNVKQLHAQWVFHSRNSDSLEVTPVVVDGVMFVTSANDAFALDARTGREIWRHERPVTSGLVDDASAHHNRGVGVWHDRILMET